VSNNCSKKIYTVEEINEIIKEAIEKGGYEPYGLMVAAGHAIYQTLRKHWPNSRKIAVICGPGDNGANGYVAATAAFKDTDLNVTVYALQVPHFSDPVAQRVFREAKASGVPIKIGIPVLEDKDIVIDAIFGNSLRQLILKDDPYYTFIKIINASNLPVLSVDVPSGLNADTGIVENTAVRATRTLTFIGIKAGMKEKEGPKYCGEISCFDDNILKECH